MADITIDVRPKLIDLLLYRGDDFGPWAFQWTQNSVPVDITGYTITAQIRISEDDATVLATFGTAITDAPNGKWQITLTDTDTLSLPPSAVWDLQLRSPGNFTRTYAKGKVKTTKDVTKPS